MKKTLIFKNKKAEDMGLKIVSLPPIQLSTEKIEEKEIDGRDGNLTEFKGYQSDTKSVECDYRGNNPLKLLEWLQGEGEVMFGNVADRYYKARINNIIPISQIIENKLYNFTNGELCDFKIIEQNVFPEKCSVCFGSASISRILNVAASVRP